MLPQGRLAATVLAQGQSLEAEKLYRQVREKRLIYREILWWLCHDPWSQNAGFVWVLYIFVPGSARSQWHAWEWPCRHPGLPKRSCKCDLTKTDVVLRLPTFQWSSKPQVLHRNGKLEEAEIAYKRCYSGALTVRGSAPVGGLDFSEYVWSLKHVPISDFFLNVSDSYTNKSIRNTSNGGDPWDISHQSARKLVDQWV